MITKKPQILNKTRALNYFKNTILASSEKNNILKIYLFGSMLKERKVRFNSDIDVVVFGRDSAIKKIEKIVDEKAFETAAKYGESVEPLIYSQCHLRNPKSVFLQRIIEEGKELYSV
ncbi:MAG: nucleotidyltransferase domain-containing protein [bacterium]